MPLTSVAARATAHFRPALKVTTREFGESVEVRVRDNGVGIPPENSEKLFQPFFTTKPTGEGTGLGLSISYEIVTQQHGGTITVDSEVGEFTEFTVRLPRRACSGRNGGMSLTSAQQYLPSTDIAVLFNHLIGSSEQGVGGTVRPSALAVLRSTTNWNLVGNWTGSSAGFVPRKMRST